MYAAEVVDVEDKFFGEVVLFSPQSPADAQRRETELMARGVDGFHARKAEVPHELRLDEGREKCAAGSVDVDGDVEASLFGEPVEREANLVDGLVLERESDAERDDDADRIFIASLQDFVGGKQQTVAFT